MPKTFLRSRRLLGLAALLLGVVTAGGGCVAAVGPGYGYDA
jgi:hypothetical protein